MTKIYQLRRRFAAYFETKYCNVVVPLTFSAAVGNSGENRAELITSDRFTQDAIEHDPRFGKEFFLSETFGEPDPEPTTDKEEENESVTIKAAPAKKKASTKKKVAEKEGKTFTSMNDAIYYLEEELGIDLDGKDIDALLKENNITVKD